MSKNTDEQLFSAAFEVMNASLLSEVSVGKGFVILEDYISGHQMLAKSKGEKENSAKYKEVLDALIAVDKLYQKNFPEEAAEDAEDED